MNFVDYATHTQQEVLDEFGVTIKMGLSREQVLKQRARYGFNEIKSNEIYWWNILFQQFKSPFVIMLILSVLLTFVLRQRTDSLMMILIVVINTTVGFYQEYSAHRTLRFLKQLVQPYVRVRRDGVVVSITQKELVPGDIVLLNPGDSIPADVRFIETQGLMIDESLLTGESAGVVKVAQALTDQPNEPFEAKNCGFLAPWSQVVRRRGLFM